MLDKQKNKNQMIHDIPNNPGLKQLTTLNSSEKINEEDKINIIFTSMDQTIINLSILCKKKTYSIQLRILY